MENEIQSTMQNKKPTTIVVHVGMPKAASTYLQTAIFPHLLKTQYLRKRESVLFKAIDQTQPAFLEELKREIKQEIARSDAESILISGEEFFGDLWRGFADGPEIAQRIEYVLPNAKIFIVIRRQDSFLESLYKYVHLQGHSILPHRFLNLYGNEFKPEQYPDRPRGINVKSYKLAPRILAWQTIFGRQNVLCVPLEMLDSAPEQFLDSFAKFMGISRDDARPRELLAKYNRSLTRLGFWVAFITNFLPNFLGNPRVREIRQRLYQKGIRYRSEGFAQRANVCFALRVFLGLNQRFLIEKVIDRVFPTRQWRFRSDIRKRIRAEFVEDNKSLSVLTGINLEEFDYY